MNQAQDHDEILSGRSALVTGASRTLGRQLALDMARCGADVVVHYHRSEDAARAVAGDVEELGRRAWLIQADLTNSDDCRRLARSTQDACGRVDILVNNVGPYTDEPLLQLGESEWNRIMDANLKAAWFLSRELVPAMRDGGWGRIINISAASAFVRDHSIYGLAKAALNLLTEVLALEAAPEVTVNAVAPGWLTYNEAPEERTEEMRQAAPLKRLCRAEDVVEAVRFLCSEHAGIMTGQILAMDGGRTLRRSVGHGDA